MADTGERRSNDDMCWCLRRLGGGPGLLLLPEGEEVSLGRGLSVTYQLVSTLCPLMISRAHCIFKQNAEGQWTITDNNSLNGVMLNKEKLEPGKLYVLPKGSYIQLGVALPNTEKVEFEYELVQENLEQIRPLLTRPQPGKSKSTRTKRKLNCEDSEASGTEGTSSMAKAKIHRVVRDSSEQTKSHKTEMSKQPTLKMAEEAAEELDGSMDNDPMASTQATSHNPSHLTKMRQFIVELKNFIDQVQEKLKTPQPGGSSDNQHLQSSQQELQELSTRREEHLQRVSELKKIFQEEQENTEEKEKVEAQKEEVLNHMNDVLDNELQCIICSEHFIEAVTLNCAHSFCSFCIQSWRKRKEECPICRQDITSQTRSLVLDNCINRMVDKLSPEMRDRRLALILERKDLAVEPAPILIPSDSDSSPLSSGSTILSDSEDDFLDMDDFQSFSSEFDADRGDLFSDDEDDDIFFIM
ncbi:E3 ubiquitin-protein ligase RNF8 isoform X3 [Hyla sarda]|uniref:E3 ubiquitin-protein ligase RNF8 isoform X3 n=1 Tax=Hyla sarda TaxID=327740 RepID=UPI0024C3B635|nr:E3 ubiquitin-protein ligase RNF8 isoform X3 [Hyla sarda]